jgi:hypothetical protein
MELITHVGLTDTSSEQRRCRHHSVLLETIPIEESGMLRGNYSTDGNIDNVPMKPHVRR